MKRALALAALVLLAACEHPVPPSPPATLPTLARPTLALHGDSRRANPVIPNDALVLRGGIPGVFVLQDGQARFRMVKTGTRQRTRTPVLSGLKGDEVLVQGDLATVHDGSPIRPTAEGRP